ncbi:hypothetical protein TWF481_011829 [Arthrobotrys musiformis]|uniref:RRM domain-containing protein n=1 Tax=Arthrobotrys musiformis TaxID=47236 RepID=A0AAV9VVA1_9PEZI
MEKSSSKRRRESSKPTLKRSQPSNSPPGKSVDNPPSKSKKSKKDAAAASDTKKSASDPVRLHITPLTAESAKAIVAAKHLSTASFHAIDTFPEKSYGFVTLPRGEAEALRKKYNGTVFRGVKMSVEEARPAREAALSPNGDGAGKAKATSPPKKTKKEDGVLPGFEIPEGRQVKRGWTKDATLKAGKSKGKPSVGTSECLFKTVLPPAIAAEMKKSDLAEDKSSKKKAKGRVVKNQVIVKEFKNSTKFPSFLKMSSLPTDSTERSAEFVEGVGWVNDSGEVIEGAPAKRRKLSVQEEPPKEVEKESDSSSSSEDEDSEDESDSSADEAEAPLTKSKSLATSSSASNSSDSEDDSESGNESESASDSAEVSSEKASPSSTSVDETPVEASEPSPSESTSNQDSSSGSESEPEVALEKAQKTKPAPASEPTVKQPSSNFANLTNIFKPKLSLDTEATSQFKFFGADLDESDEQEDEGGSEAEDDQPSFGRFNDSILYTPITPQGERYRSGAPTPDTAVAPRFKDFLPFPKDFEISVERDYFPTLAAEEKPPARKPSTGARLMFPHTHDNTLFGLSIWGSVDLPKVLTTGELPEKQASSGQETKEPKNAGDIEMAVPEERSEQPPVTRQPVAAAKRKDSFAPKEVEQPKTGSGSKIIGWAGKKKTFGDADDFDMVDAPVAGAPKAKTGAGSGVVGWAGKKKTFDDDDDDFSAPAPVVENQAKTKTGAGSGVTGWAGKKTFDDEDDEDLGFAAPVEASAKAKTGAGSGVTAWAGKKKTFDDEDQDDQEIEETDKPAAPKASTQKSKTRSQEKDTGSEQARLPISKVWEKVFYENRGEWNRQWKRKKREVAKAKRKKEKAKRGWAGISA